MKSMDMRPNKQSMQPEPEDQKRKEVIKAKLLIEKRGGGKKMKKKHKSRDGLKGNDPRRNTIDRKAWP